MITKEKSSSQELRNLSGITNHKLNTPKISIIIPTLNEAKNIQATLATINTATDIEVIVVDGGSEDDTVAITKQYCKQNAGDGDIKIISGYRGRALQMNAGAAAATGEILLFLHADTRLPAEFDVMVRKIFSAPISKSKIVAGAFTLKIDAKGMGLRLVEWGVKLRSHLWEMPYGDQAIFLKKQTFEEIGGFPELPIMEDFELIGRLKSLGKITIVPVPVVTSARRWLQKGIFQTTLINQIVIIAYFLGVSPQRLRSLYRQGKLIPF
ncbi:TIGR04283 family arsenosugar biosynthesis glycosyltransferase [Mastigocoleus sp. MO_188.B34]|uniref:TIGR04283 family arsenosugar biosynthesis glycosyltransferase n=1 Tax=Mastigocoleus sp. MO_188.B34 TaxID=3036635 RepID=UPI002631D157|nr:TIGR04283 family arsenosugar biosynthesis glycosyltransferase [Mastigocoleus sp. MO_188.B34]MDJ0697195.1 TIGR04283 family arsenosugar biosynthesis glycosyltransferase [Mastigocoleus sp. MO_188.B34]